MSDFLQSIRNQSKDKRYQHNHQSRRPYDHNNGGHSNHHHNQQNHHNNQQQYQNNQNNSNNYHHRNNNDNQNNYHRNNDNRRYHQRPRNDYAQKDENLGLIKDLLETMVTQQNQAMEIHERRAIAEERKAEAIEEIASIISSLAGAEFPTIDKVVSGIDAVAREYEDELGLVDDEPMDDLPEQEAAPAAEMSKDEIIGMIHKMRAQGSTYNEVAAHLTELGLPTFSGRGKWHAQTIHRLCQQEG
ncbi:hypothetical protein [Desulfoluna butyratoxydans]|uniref:Recombinase n=1 Tax=Desulfoluna butyratoxydans TaxID=231438 RepID=A0A4U8YKQ0_9BACT|nr:hypothetical protein [Desulfoluna butyratoxydans]VFQ44130.1 hypothetical protein MSL71_17740 [Desulfoluna butyratoxydans]